MLCHKIHASAGNMQPGKLSLLKLLLGMWLQLETRIDCPLTELQTFWYRRLLLRDSSLLVALEADAAKAGVKASVPHTHCPQPALPLRWLHILGAICLQSLYFVACGCFSACWAFVYFLGGSAFADKAVSVVWMEHVTACKLLVPCATVLPPMSRLCSTASLTDICCSSSAKHFWSAQPSSPS